MPQNFKSQSRVLPLFTMLLTFSIAMFCALCLFASPVMAATNCSTTYYISSSGSDKNTGLTTSKPWKTISKVNSTSFKPGSCILFEGGKWFVGDMQVSDYDDTTTVALPIQIGTYGTGKAGLYSQNGNALSIYDIGNVFVDNIYFFGGGDTTNQGNGINIYSDKAASGGVAHGNIVITNVEIGYFGKSGISIGGWGNSVGVDSVQISNSTIHDNGLQGIITYGPRVDFISNVQITNVDVSFNRGISNLSNNNGDGIILGYARNSSVNNSRVFENGSRCSASSCGSGIMVYNSKNITIEKNKVYNNHTNSKSDGNGIDFDMGTRDCIMQDNEVYGNDAPGVLLFNNINDQNFAGNIVRYNMVKDNGAKNSTSDIAIGGYVNSMQVYNNTIRTTSAGNTTPVTIWNWNGNGISLLNNIFYKSGSQGYNITFFNSAGTGVSLMNNNYYSVDGNFRSPWNGGYFTSFSKWEIAVGETGGSILNPVIDNSTLKTQAGSPMIDAGVALPLSIFDFWGTSVPINGNTDIGATEVN